MNTSEGLILAKAKDYLAILPQMGNRHGLIAGATGTGKTVTLRTMAERSRVIQQSLVFGHYEKVVDRESAYEILRERAEQAKVQQTAQGPVAKEAPKSQGKTLFEAVAKSAAHAIGSQIGRQIIRGVLGSLMGGKRR